MLGLCWWRVLEADECFRYVIKYGDMDTFVDVVPVDSHSKTVCTTPVLGAFVVFFVLSGCQRGAQCKAGVVFDAKVVCTECEGYWAKIMLP